MNKPWKGDYKHGTKPSDRNVIADAVAAFEVLTVEGRQLLRPVQIFCASDDYLFMNED